MSERLQNDSDVPNQKTCWALIERVAESSVLRRSERLRSLLFYVGKRSLREGQDELHEQEIGIDVYRRPVGYDTNLDNIVRVNASELRKRLAVYFETEGAQESLTMDIPRGTYVPVFRHRLVVPPAKSDVEDETAYLAATKLSETNELTSKETTAGRWSLSVAVPYILAVGLAIACANFWILNRSLNQALSPWQYDPGLFALWKPFLEGTRDTDVVMEDSSFLLVQNIDHRTYSFNDYQNRSFLNSQQSTQLSLESRISRDSIATKVLARAAEVRLIQKFLALDPGNGRIHIYNAREYTPGLTTRNNIVIVGNPTSNPWLDIFQDRLNFRESPDSQTQSDIINTAPLSNEKPIYVPTSDISYGVVAFLPKADHTGYLLLIQGTTSEATEACGNFILSKELPPSLMKIMKNPAASGGVSKTA